ncbi:MAG: hypothetical protein IRY90_08925, partial [Actinomadura rubrobrunea]|nr:hypothetical protein [Actinomadura rubrobrunea]
MAFTLAGAVAQVRYGLWIGVILGLAVFALAAFRAGAVWQRAGAALLVSICGLALMFSAGPTVYALYLKTMGEEFPPWSSRWRRWEASSPTCGAAQCWR